MNYTRLQFPNKKLNEKKTKVVKAPEEESTKKIKKQAVTLKLILMIAYNVHVCTYSIMKKP